MNDFDAVVIGSGAGGLTAAVALAQAGKKVLVAEQHEVPGGWCHSFTLSGHKFSPGVHYLGELGEGGRLRAIYEGLGVADDLVFCELNPDGFDHVQIGGERFDYPKGLAAFRQRLCERFPREKRGIEKYLGTVATLGDELNALFEFKGLRDVLTLPFRAPRVARWGLATAESLINSHVEDPLLRAILAAQAGDHGLPPSMAPAAVHAGVQAHYFDGGWYPRGGGFAIPRAFTRALKRAGGVLKLSTPVERILLEGGKAIGVKLAGGEEVRCGAVVSNADPHVTYVRMLGQHPRKLDRTRWSVSALSLFFAAQCDLRALGMDSGNLWHYASTDLEGIYRHGMTDWTRTPGEIPGMFVTATTLKDPSKGDGRTHTMEAFAFVSNEGFRALASRPPEYAQLKAALHERMLQAVDRAVPGLRKHITFSDLGTPLTNWHYCMSTEGNLYGTEKSRWQVGPWAWPVRAPGVEQLFLCGASTLSHGVMGATFSGLIAAREVLGCKVRDFLKPTGQKLLCVPSEHPEEWPQELRRREAA